MTSWNDGVCGKTCRIPSIGPVAQTLMITRFGSASWIPFGAQPSESYAVIEIMTENGDAR